MPEAHARLTLTYEVHSGGDMCVTQSIAFDESYVEMPEMLRFGMVMKCPTPWIIVTSTVAAPSRTMP